MKSSRITPLAANKKTQYFTGIAINQEITRLEEALYGGANPLITPALIQQVSQLNALVRPMLEGLIGFKTGLLNDVLSCRMFTANYPLLIDHILREAKLYHSHLIALENRQNPEENLKETELFWDQIMMEHALFIRGLLDPTECDLINTANDFAGEYNNLMQAAMAATDMTIDSVTDTTLQKKLKCTGISKKRVQKESMNAKYAVLFCLCWRIMCCVNQTIISGCFDNYLNILFKQVLLYTSSIEGAVSGHSCIFCLEAVLCAASKLLSSIFH